MCAIDYRGSQDTVLEPTLAALVEHYEIAGYGNARAIAEAIGNNDVAELLEATLDEEKAADEKLTEVGQKLLHSEGRAVFIAS